MVTGYESEPALAAGEGGTHPGLRPPLQGGDRELPSWEGCRVSGGVGLERWPVRIRPVSA